PLRYDAHVKTLGHGDHRLHNRGIVAAANHVVHEHRGDLDGVDWKLFQIRKRAAAPAEIIDGQQDADFFQRLQDLGRAVAIAQRSVRNFELYVVRIEPAVANCLIDVLYKRMTVEVAAGKIDRDASLHAGVLPFLRLTAGG